MIKPDVVAPGQFYPASAPLNPTHGKRDSTNKYQLFNGTSAATPYVAGILALVYEKNPGITYGEVKSLLHKCASVDSYTGSCPNPKWGYGKLNVDAVKRLIASVR